MKRPKQNRCLQTIQAVVAKKLCPRLQVTLVIPDGPGYTFRARKPSNGCRISGRPVDYWCVSYLEIFRQKKPGKFKKTSWFPEYLSAWVQLVTIVFVLFTSIQWYAAVAEFLSVYASVDKTMLRFTTTKLHKCRTRGKKNRRFINNNHLIFWSFNFEQVPRVLDRLNKVDTPQDR